MKQLLVVLTILFTLVSSAYANDLAYESGPSCSVGSLTIPRHKKDPVVVPGCSVSCETGEKAVCDGARVISAYHYSYASCKCVEKRWNDED